MTVVHIDFNAARNLFIADTGGLVLQQVSDWLGWKRTPQGIYIASPWVSSVLSVSPSPSVQVKWLEAAAKKRDRLLADLNGARTALRLGHSLSPVPTERKPRQHQLQAVHAIRSMEFRALLADEMGLGKTATALWAAHGEVNRLLVICPVSVKFNWAEEIRTTIGQDWVTFVINGSSKRRADQFSDAIAASGKSWKVAVIINYDLLLHVSAEQKGWMQQFAANGMVIFDEMHYLKSRIAKRTQECGDIAKRATAVLGLTGTPIRNLADDLYSQIEIIRPGTWTSYRDFAKRYLVIQSVKMGKREISKVVGVRNLTDLNAVLNTVQIRRKKEEVLDLPAKIYAKPMLELEGDQAKLYKAMKEFARIELGKLLETDKQITVFDPRAKSAIEQALRCEQIAQGFIGGIPDPVMAKLGPDILKHAEKIPGRPNELIFPHAPKLLWMLEAIDAIKAQGGAPLVFSRFNAPMFWLASKLATEGIRSLVLHGGLSASDKDHVTLSFQNGQSDCLIAQVKMAEGWNAFRSQDVLFLGRDWSPAINWQAEDRAHRMGQKGTVNVQIPIVRKTIEVMIDRRLQAKDADATMALRSVTVEELMDEL